MIRKTLTNSQFLACALLCTCSVAYARERPDQLEKLKGRRGSAAGQALPPHSPLTPKARPELTSSNISLTSNGNPLSYGASVKLTATVSPSAATGIVTFYNGGIPIGSSALSSGVATFTTVLLSAGTDYVTARYEGNSTYLGSAAPPLLETIQDAVGVGFPSYNVVNVGSNPPPVPSWVSVGDFNGDGIQDLVSILAGTNQVAISLGEGNGTFQAPFLFSTGLAPYALVVGDFNQDGIPDLAVTSNDGIDILLGTGHGQFLSYTPYATPATGSGASSFGLAVGDFNSDGIPDLVVTDGLGTNSAGAAGLVSVFLGVGNGTFPNRSDYVVGQLPQAVTVADFNNDGHPDFAVADILDNSVYIYLGNSSGTFTLAPGSPVFAGNQPNDITSLNIHGFEDLVVANATDNQVQILTGNGSGQFTPQPGINVGNEPDSLVVADFNGDLVPDVAVVNSSDNTLTVLLNINGELTSSGTYGGCETCNYVQVAAGDFNNDGVTDLVVADQGQDTPPGGLNVLLGQGCSYTVYPTSLYQDDTSASQSIILTGNGSTCSWSATNSNSWITLNTSSGNGAGGQILATLAANSTGADRSGTLTVAGHTISVLQRSTKEAFSDVAPADYQFDAVNLLYAKGITAGCGTDLYCPNTNITRAQMAVFIVTAVYNGTSNFTYSPTPYFTDVPVGSFGFAYIQHMYELGITAGCGAQLFCPDSTVTRDQMAIFIIKARFGSTTAYTFPAAPYFADVPASYFAFNAIQRLRFDNITAGCTATDFCPTNPVTRGDMAIFVMIGEFNDLLPAGTPIISSITPAVLTHGQTGVFTVTGISTNFIPGQTQFVFGASSGITVNTINVNSATSMTVSLSAATDALLFPNSIYVQTGSQEAVLPNGLTIQ
jgi:hypothetical protein